MADQQKIAPANETEWYRRYWQGLGVKFLFGFFAGLAVLGLGFLFALYFVVRLATAHGYADYAESLML